jgi:hypothetical protein
VRFIKDYQYPGDILNIREPFNEILDPKLIVNLPSVLHLGDHLEGIDATGHNHLLDLLQKRAELINSKFVVFVCFYPTEMIIKNYDRLDLRYARDDQEFWYFGPLKEYTTHPPLQYKNFMCAFNGTGHVSRKMLVAIMERFHWYDPKFSSKNFTFTPDVLDGHLHDFVGDQISLYRKFFISNSSEDFFNHVNGFGHDKFKIVQTVKNLEDKITQSFLHLVSESMATSYSPFITEKFLYSVITRGLFLTWGQPGWHVQLEKNYGFRLYQNLFDYSFDSVVNPVDRLLSLISMISKFSVLTPHEWHDLYLLEQDNIEYNYDHYFSGRYLDCLKVDNTINFV